MVNNTNKSLKSYNISNWMSRLQNIKRIRGRATENLALFNTEMIHHMRGTINSGTPHTPHPLSSHGRARLGTGPSQSSRDESDSVISSSVASPAIPGSAGILSNSSMGTFDYDTGARLAFPDFTEFTKDLN